jgi:hypothetical protein
LTITGNISPPRCSKSLTSFHSLVVKNVGLDAARQVVQHKVLDIEFKPTGSTDLSEPKFGKVDPKNEPHTGGNTWAGGVSSFVRPLYELIVINS